jgi:SulP family sulfate permease
VTSEKIIRERRSSDPTCNRLLIYDFEGELFFGASPDFEAELSKIHHQVTDDVKVVVLRLKNARNVDGVCLDLLLEFINRMSARGVTVLLCGVRAATMEVLKNAKLEERLGPQRIFPEGAAMWTSTTEAIGRAYEILGTDICVTCPSRPSEESGPWYSMI